MASMRMQHCRTGEHVLSVNTHTYVCACLSTVVSRGPPGERRDAAAAFNENPVASALHSSGTPGVRHACRRPRGILRKTRHACCPSSDRGALPAGVPCMRSHPLCTAAAGSTAQHAAPSAAARPRAPRCNAATPDRHRPILLCSICVGVCAVLSQRTRRALRFTIELLFFRKPSEVHLWPEAVNEVLEVVHRLLEAFTHHCDRLWDAGRRVLLFIAALEAVWGQGVEPLAREAARVRQICVVQDPVQRLHA